MNFSAKVGPRNRTHILLIFCLRIKINGDILQLFSNLTMFPTKNCCVVHSGEIVMGLHVNCCVAILAAGLFVPTGCSRRIEPPDISADEAASKAFEEFDRNRDGKLEGLELERCPGIYQSRSFIDKDNDGKVSVQELTERIAMYKERKIGLVAVNCRVTQSGRPLAGATVKFVPEKFMGPNLKPAQGVTNADGRVAPFTEGQELPGVACGFFRIEVTKKELGQEMIPPKYVGPTVLGIEVSPETTGSLIRLNLTN
jgi:EF hand